MAFPATHAKRDAIVLQASRGFASAPNSPRVFLQSGNKRSDLIQMIRHADKPGCPDIEAMVQRICSLFPTAREYDVRELLIKYHYREAVVVSALQVLKYPLTMPGPATATNVTATPPTRHLTSYYVPPSNHHAHTAWSETMSDGRMSKLGGAFSTNSNTPMHSPSPIRPNHSPKIKLKYLKSVFPKAEETFLLDLLVGSDNNVNQVTQQLLTLGHQKKDKPQPLTPRRSVMTPTPSVAPQEPPEIPPKLTPSLVEMLMIKSELKKVFPEEEEAVIQLALESTDFDLERAKLILSNSQEREESYSTVKNLTLSGIKHTVTLSSLKSSPSVLSTFKDIATLYSPMKERGTDDDGFQRCKPKHHPITLANHSTASGPDDSLLSHSYVTPNGSQRDLVRGPNKSLLRSTDSKGCLVKELHQRVSVQGPNAANRQGPKETPRGSLAKIILTKLKRDSTRRV